MRLFTPLAACALLSSLAGAVKPVRSGKFTFYTLPTQFSGPCDLSAGHGHTIWVQDLLIDKLAELDPTTGRVQEVNIPYTLNPSPVGVLPGLGNRTALACVVRQGSDGLLYFASGVRNQIGSINETTKAINIYTPQPYNPGGNLFFFNDFWTGAKGMFFTMTTGNQIAFLDYASKNFTYVSTSFPITGGPLGLRLGPDNRMWGTEIFANRIFALNQTTFDLQEFQILNPLLLAPGVMRVATQGRYLWFCAFAGGGLGRIDIYTKQMTAYPAPALLAAPTENALDGNGNIWFSSITLGSLFKFDPKTGKYTEYPIPSKFLPGGLLNIPIAVHYRKQDNAMYFTLAGPNNQIGKLSLDLL